MTGANRHMALARRHYEGSPGLTVLSTGGYLAIIIVATSMSTSGMGAPS